MSENLLIAIAYGLTVSTLIGLGLYGLCAIFDRCIDEIWPLSPEALAQREAEKLQRKADKEIKRRDRMNVVRFWNF
jgi:hypothetical protein